MKKWSLRLIAILKEFDGSYYKEEIEAILHRWEVVSS